MLYKFPHVTKLICDNFNGTGEERAGTGDTEDYSLAAQ
jgi:hypothetical protein